MLRHQLAAYSPITAGACVQSLAASLGLRGDERPRLLDLVLREYRADRGVLCGSGTQALQLAIRAAASVIGGSGPVALPAFTCFDVASAAVGAGAQVALYDVDPDTLGPDFESLERILANGARIVVVGPLYGVPVAWDSIEAMAARFGALVIEDAAQGHGATWRERPLGSLGAISTLSFGRGKGWTGGNGGAVLFRGGEWQGSTPAPSLDVQAASVTIEAKTSVGMLAQWALGRPAVYGLPRSVPGLGLGVTTYRPPVEPAAMPRSAAAGAVANRPASLVEAADRRENAQRFLDELRESATVGRVRVGPDAVAGYLRLPVRIRGGLEAHPSCAGLRALGVEASYPSTLAELPAIRERLVPGSGRWPGADALCAELLTVPTHSLVTATERNQIVAALVSDANSLAPA